LYFVSRQLIFSPVTNIEAQVTKEEWKGPLNYWGYFPGFYPVVLLKVGCGVSSDLVIR
jgi:hypothetical protein